MSADLILAFILSAFTSIFESVGDYHTAARVSEEAVPPSHAINRGIIAEGAGSLFAALFGPALGMTTRTENIGVMGVTRVASRSVMVVSGIILISLGICTKVSHLSCCALIIIGGSYPLHDSRSPGRWYPCLVYDNGLRCSCSKSSSSRLPALYGFCSQHFRST